MFEMIGVLFGIVVLLLAAGVLGAIFAGVAWLVLRRCSWSLKLPVALLGAGIPVVSAAYVWTCVALLPGESLFGDISQPLPSGYWLRALGKMPDFASIYDTESEGSSRSYQTEEIGSLGVEGPLVVGHYSHPFSTFDAKPREPYFVFDTKTAQIVDYQDLVALEGKLGHSVHLVATDQFRSAEPFYVKQQKIDRTIMFTPPIAATVLYIVLLVWARRSRRT